MNFLGLQVYFLQNLEFALSKMDPGMTILAMTGPLLILELI